MNQHTAPIVEALAKVERRPPVGFGAPGHGIGRAATRDILALVGRRAFEADVLTPKGLDDRSEEGQVVQRATYLAADAWDADLCRFVTGGSTQSLHTALAAVARPGETVVLAGNCHKAEFASAVFSGLDVRVVPACIDPDWGIEHGVDPKALETVLVSAPEARAVVVVSPTYFGVTSDIAVLAEVCHLHDVPLIVDAAWGAAFGFSSALPANPMREGADMAVCSVHKTLASLAQGSVLLLKGDRVDRQRFKLAYELFETTSPSVPVMASLDATRREHALHGEAIWAKVVRRARRLRKRLSRIAGVRVMGREVVGRAGAHDLDETKVLFDVSALGVTGYEADDWLVRERRVSVGLSDARHCLAILSVGVTGKDAARLLEGVEALAAYRRGREPTAAARAAAAAPPLPPLEVDMVVGSAAAFSAPATELVAWARATGRIAAEIIAPAPPGVPRLIPGQRITSDHVAFLQGNVEAGAFILDPADEEGKKVRVLPAAPVQAATPDLHRSFRLLIDHLATRAYCALQ